MAQICIQCGAEMKITKVFAGTMWKKGRKRWTCTNGFCNHEETINNGSTPNSLNKTILPEDKEARRAAKNLPDSFF